MNFVLYMNELLITLSTYWLGRGTGNFVHMNFLQLNYYLHFVLQLQFL